jgi:hypothetical protein
MEIQCSDASSLSVSLPDSGNRPWGDIAHLPLIVPRPPNSTRSILDGSLDAASRSPPFAPPLLYSHWSASRVCDAGTSAHRAAPTGNPVESSLQARRAGRTTRSAPAVVTRGRHDRSPGLGEPSPCDHATLLPSEGGSSSRRHTGLFAGPIAVDARRGPLGTSPTPMGETIPAEIA